MTNCHFKKKDHFHMTHPVVLVYIQPINIAIKHNLYFYIKPKATWFHFCKAFIGLNKNMKN